MSSLIGGASAPIGVVGSVAAAQIVAGIARQADANPSNNHNLLLNRDAPDQHPISAITGLETALGDRFDDAWVEEGYLILAKGDETIRLGPFAGGSGSTGNNATLTLQNKTGWIYKSVAQNTACVLKAVWSSLEDELPTGGGILTIKVGGAVKHMESVNQGDIEIDVSPYLSAGSNSVKLTVTDVYDNSRSISFTISVVALTLTSTFDPALEYSGPITFPYVPSGSVSKVVHFILDGIEIGTETVVESGRQQSFVIPEQLHGSHTWMVYFTATVDGEEVSSNVLYYDIICTEAGISDPVITSTFRATTAEQFVGISIPHYVLDPANLIANVVYKANGTVVSEVSVDRTLQNWNFVPTEVGNLLLTIECGTTVKSFSVIVTESSVNVEATTKDLVLYLSAYGRSNGEADPGAWGYGGIAASLSGFNFVSDGWISDDDGNTVLRVTGNARVSIPLKLFADDFRTSGKTIEIEFETRNVLDYDAEIISCWSGGRGIKLTAQMATFSSEQTTIQTQYKEDEHVRMTFVVEKRSENQLVYIYLNGVMCGVAQYPDTDDFSQQVPVDISIGSSDCTVDISCIRVYDNSLTRVQVLNNWIADTQNGALKKARFERNNIYDDYGSIVIDRLPKNLPVMVWAIPILPAYKGDKRNADEITFDNKENADASFIALIVLMNVQGTSSQYYYRKNFVIEFLNGLTVNGTEVMKYPLRNGAIPEKKFTLKADVASSEGCNNVELVRLYNDASKDYGILTPPQQADSRVRVAIDGFPMVCFHNNGTQTYFYGKFNFNNDKGTPDTFGFAPGDESWEFLNNTSNRTLFKSADFTGDDWTNDIEARYPDKNTDLTNLAAMFEWVVSTDRTQATGAALPETYVDADGTEHTVDDAAYRLAKFRTELDAWFDVDSCLFYYLFTEIFLLVDSRAKNAFPTRFASNGKWYWFPYDMDTAMGINNEGALVFGYSLEDTDTVDGADVYNGQNSTFWCNVRDAFTSKLREMYQALRSGSYINYSYVEETFEAHQAAWPEAIFNEDSYSKCLEPLFVNNDNTYLEMLQGPKAEQRKWWLYNRFRYMDSKYNAGDALSDYIQLRGYSKDSITITPYADIYASVKYGSYLVQTRALRGSSYTLDDPLDNVNDTEILIFSASQLKSIGDISGLKVGLCDLSRAIKLQAVKLGDSSADYSNPNLKQLTFGNNTLLKLIDCRNCINLGTGVTAAPDISGCTNIEEIYFDNTAITGLTLPNGGIIRVLHLPSTVANLTIRNQTSIEDFVMPSYDNITTLWLENIGPIVDAPAIISAIAENSRVRLVGIDWSFGDDITVMDKLLTMRGLDEHGNNTANAVVSGSVYFETLSASKLLEYEAAFPYVTFTVGVMAVDILVDADGKAVFGNDGKVIATLEGGYNSVYPAAQIDDFIVEVQAQMALINGENGG